MTNKIFYISLMMSIFLSVNDCFSKVQEPISSTESKFKQMSYCADCIHKYVGAFNNFGSITFEEDEIEHQLIMNPESGWKTHSVGRMLFMKPTDARTKKEHVTILTNKRRYEFFLDAKHVENIDDDPEISFDMKFLYEKKHSPLSIAQNSSSNADSVDKDHSFYYDVFDSMSDARGINTNYGVKGDDRIKPVQIFDNGIFTYLKFDNRKYGAELPVVYSVDPEGYISLVNFRVKSNGFIEIEQIAPLFQLKSSHETVYIRNHEIPYKRKKVSKANRVK